MAANITNQDYSQQINTAFNALKFATPQQLAAVSKQVTPNSPEALALAMATQYQQEMRRPNPTAPTQTVTAKHLEQLQGIPNVGPNQMALQQAAAQNPNMAGIAAAPENMAPPPQAGIPGAATGGLVAFNHGGEVRGFAGGRGVYIPGLSDMYGDESYGIPTEMGSSSYGSRSTTGMFGDTSLRTASNKAPTLEDIKEQIARDEAQRASGTPFKDVEQARQSAGLPSDEPTPKHEEVKPGADKTPSAKKIAENHPAKQDEARTAAPGAQKVSTAPSDTISGSGITSMRTAFGLGDVADTADTSGVKGIMNSSNSAESKIQAIQDALGMPYSMSAELKGKLEKEKADADKNAFFKAGLAGLGTMLATPTEHWKKALGTGLVSAVNQYDQDKEGGKFRDMLLGQQIAEEQAPSQMRQQAGLEFLKSQQASQLAGLKSQGDLTKQVLANQARIQAAEIAAAARSQGDTPDKIFEKLVVGIGNTLGPAGVSPENIRQMAHDLAYGTGTAGAGGAPSSNVGSFVGGQFRPAQ